MSGATIRNGMWSPPASPQPSSSCQSLSSTHVGEYDAFPCPKVKLVIPPELLPHTSTATAAIDCTETKAKIAVLQAFANSPQQFLHRYKVHSIIGFGSNGVVLAAQDVLAPSQDSSVAIKIIYKKHVGNDDPTPPEIVSLLKLNSKVRSSGILISRAAWQDSQQFYLVTELFGNNFLLARNPEPMKPLVFKTVSQGVTSQHSLACSTGASDLWAFTFMLRDNLKRHKGHTRIPLEIIKNLMYQIALALLAMHDTGYYHGDIKMENILIQVAENDVLHPSVKLADYGHTRRVKDGIKHYGTMDLSPPEFLDDSPHTDMMLDGRMCDVFALGMVLYALLDDKGGLPQVMEEMSNGDIGFVGLLALGGSQFPFQDIPGQLERGSDVWDLLNKMCMVNPSNRLTLEGVLQHRWFSL